MVKDPTTPSHAPVPNSVSDDTAELLAAYALDAVPADQEATVAATLAESAAARALLAEYRRVAHLIPYAVPRSTPSPLVRDAVLQAVRARRPRRHRSRALLWQYTIAAVLLVGLLVWNLGLQLGAAHRSGSDTAARAAQLFGTPGLIAYDMAARPAAPQATGRIYLSPDEKQAAMVVRGMPPLPPDRAYQLWFNLDPRTPVRVATFTVDARGAAMVILPVPPADRPYASCWITEEPRSGSASPTGPGLLGAEWEPTETYAP